MEIVMHPSQTQIDLGTYLTFEAIIFVLIFIALGSCLYLITQLGQGSLIIPFTHFGAGIIFLGLARAFTFLTTMEIYRLQPVTLDLWEHVIFYIAMISFVWGVIRLRQIATMPSTAGYAMRDSFLLISLFLVEFLVFGLAQPLENSLAPVLKDSIVTGLGIPHIISFLLVILVGIRVYLIKTEWFKLLPLGIYPMLAFLLLLSIKHLAQLLIHSWGIINIPSDILIIIDQFLLILAFISLTFGFLRISGSLEQSHKLS